MSIVNFRLELEELEREIRLEAERIERDAEQLDEPERSAVLWAVNRLKAYARELKELREMHEEVLR